VLADRVAKGPGLSGIDGLAASMLIAALVVTPIGAWAAIPAFNDPIALLAGIGVGVSSSVIPTSRTNWPSSVSTAPPTRSWVSLLPATATVIGIAVLTQIPTPVEIIGVTLVVVGVALHRQPRTAA